jgi:L-lactate dehydrogenase complex protein LldG
MEQRLERFCAALEKLAGKAYVASSREDAAAYVRSVVGERAALATGCAVLRECGIDYPEIAPDRAEVGITGADYGLAETGTIVVLSASEPRLTSLLPPVHVAILRREKMLTNLDELLEVLPDPAAQTASMVLITGPSRTADIEQILIRGVHGPGELHVIVL